MPDLVLEEMIRGYLSTDQPVYTFGWQGGEPLFMGVNFFRRIILTLLKKQNFTHQISSFIFPTEGKVTLIFSSNINLTSLTAD